MTSLNSSTPIWEDNRPSGIPEAVFSLGAEERERPMSPYRTSRISAVILAAGLSSRMKAFKPLLPVDGKPMVQRCIGLFSDNGNHPILSW